jgi:hypothetical protein
VSGWRLGQVVEGVQGIASTADEMLPKAVIRITGW